jgi:hypothetical protein
MWSARVEQALGLEAFQHGVQQHLLGAARDQAAAQRTEHRGSKAGSGHLQGESILPVAAAPDGRGRLLIREALGILQHQDQSHTPRGFRRLATRGDQGGTRFVLLDDAPFSAHAPVGLACGKGGTSDAGGFLRDGVDRLRVQGHHRLHILGSVA